MGIQTGGLKVSKWGGLKFCPFATQEVHNWAKTPWVAHWTPDSPHPPTYTLSLSHGLIK